MSRRNKGLFWIATIALCLMTACSSGKGKTNTQTTGNAGQESNNAEITQVQQGYETVAKSVELAKIEGSIGVQSKSGNDVKPMEGMFLYNGHSVTTKEESYAYLALDDTRAAKLGQFSSVEVRKEDLELSLYLSSGEMFFNVARHLEDYESMNIRTSTMVTGIRGTSGFVRVIDFTTSEVYILDGEVWVTVTDPYTGISKSVLVSAGQMATTAVFTEKQNDNERVDITIRSFTEEEIPAYIIAEIAGSANLQGRIIRGNVLNSPKIIGLYEERLKQDKEQGKDYVAQIRSADASWIAMKETVDEMFVIDESVLKTCELTDPTLQQVQEALDDEQYLTVNVSGSFVFGDGESGLTQLVSFVPTVTNPKLEKVTKGFSYGKVTGRLRYVDKEGEEVLTVPAGKSLNLNGKTSFGSKGSIQNYGIVTNNGSLWLGGQLTNVDEGQFINNGELRMPDVEIVGVEHVHVVVTDPAVPATCLEDGLTKGSHCATCNEILVAQKRVPATGHKAVKIDAVSPSCEGTGLTEGLKCELCGEMLVAQEVIPANGHQMVSVKVKEPTCTEAGHSGGNQCSVCGKADYETYPALGHVLVSEEGYPATCTEDGLTEGAWCERCEQWITPQTVISRLGHNWVTYDGADVAAGNHEATCTESCYINQICTRCEERRVDTSVPALGHIEVVDVEAKPALCMENGCTKGWHCSRPGCGYVEESQTINMIGYHSYEPHDGKEPTCQEGGYFPYEVCSVCGDVFNYIPREAVDHKFTDDNDNPLEYCAYGCGTHNPNW